MLSSLLAGSGGPTNISTFSFLRIVLEDYMIKGRMFPEQRRLLQNFSPTKLLFTCLRFEFSPVFFVGHLHLVFFSIVMCVLLLQDEALLASWKNQLERDTETLKMKSNLGHLRTVRTTSIFFLFIFAYSVIPAGEPPKN